MRGFNLIVGSITVDDWLPLLLSLLGLWMVILRFRNAARARASQNWPSTQGQIITSYVRVEQDSEEGPSFYPEIHFKYQVAGREYVGAKIDFSPPEDDQEKAEEKVAKYPENASVRVYYDPQHPSKAVLERRAAGGSALLIVGVFFIVMGILFALRS